MFDNVNRVVTQAVTTVNDSPTLIFPREIPQSKSELITSIQQVLEFGFTPDDLSTFAGQLLRYLVTSPERRHSDPWRKRRGGMSRRQRAWSRYKRQRSRSASAKQITTR